MKVYNRHITIIIILCCAFRVAQAQGTVPIISEKAFPNSFLVTDAPIYVDAGDDPLIQQAGSLLQEDIGRVTGKKPDLVNTIPVSAKNIIIIGSQSGMIRNILREKKIDTRSFGKGWESYYIRGID